MTLSRLMQGLTGARGAAAPAEAPEAAPTGEDGFTLVEVVVALAILALTLSVLFGVTSEGLRRTEHARRLAEAGSLAQSLLARVGVEHPLRVGETSGEFPRAFRWHLRIAPHADQPARDLRVVDAFAISIQVLWNDGEEREVALSSVRVGPREEAR